MRSAQTRIASGARIDLCDPDVVGERPYLTMLAGDGRARFALQRRPARRNFKLFDSSNPGQAGNLRSS